MKFGLPYRLRSALGMLLRRVKTCRTRREEGDVWFIRTRPWYGTCLIAPANWCLRWLSAGVSILPTRQWLDWECRLHSELSSLVAERAGRRRLLLPQIEGEELAAILSSPAKDLPHKDRALRLAAAALVRSHQRRVLWPDGVCRSFSHGDATARNVICQVASGVATWIDFETLHDPRRSVAWRQADDLRALTWSAAEMTGADSYEAVCIAILDAVSDVAVLSELTRVADNERPNIYQVAQGSLSSVQHRQLCSVLAVAIAERQSRASREFPDVCT